MVWGRFRASFFTVFLRPSVDMYLLLVLMVAGMDPVQVPTFSEKNEQTESTEKTIIFG